MVANTARLSAIPEAGECTDLRLDGLGDHLARLKDQSIRLRFARGETIAAAGETAAHIYLVSAGCMRLCHRGADGRRHVSDFLFGGDIWGLGDARVFALSAEAVSPVTLTAYPRAPFERLGEGNNRLRADVLAHLCDAIQAAHRHLYLLGCLSARERLASFLVRMMQKPVLVYGDRLDLPMARQDIADHLGLTIETVCRALASLKSEAVIEVPNAHLVIVRKPEVLHTIAGFLP